MTELFCVGVTELISRGYDGGGAGAQGRGSDAEGGWVLGSARYPRRSAGMTELFCAGVMELISRG